MLHLLNYTCARLSSKNPCRPPLQTAPPALPPGELAKITDFCLRGPSPPGVCTGHLSHRERQVWERSSVQQVLCVLPRSPLTRGIFTTGRKKEETACRFLLHYYTVIFSDRVFSCLFDPTDNLHLHYKNQPVYPRPYAEFRVFRFHNWNSRPAYNSAGVQYHPVSNRDLLSVHGYAPT